jgi:hypothetical protein
MTRLAWLTRIGTWLRATGDRASRQRVFVYEGLILIFLWLLAYLYFQDVVRLPRAWGSIPIGVPWFGATGAVLISLSAVFDFTGRAWRSSWELWHYSRPFIGATVAVVGVLIFQAGIVSIGSDPTPSASSSGGINKDLAYYVIAFIVGYREATFRELVKRAADVLLSPGETKKPMISSVQPPSRPLAGGEISVIGTGLGRLLSVKVGSNEVDPIDVSEGHLILRVPPAQAAGIVPLTVETKDGSAATTFEYR